MSDLPRPSTLQRATDNRLSGGRDFGDVRTWRDEYGERGETGLIPAAVLVAAFAIEMVTGGPARWGLSAQALAEGRFDTLGLHMISHGGVSHLLMNLSGLMVLTPLAMRRFGTGWTAWPRWLILFVGAGLVGALLFLAINPAGGVPMVGASGAICGLWGFAARVDADGALVGLRSAQVIKTARRFAVTNLILFVILYALARLADAPGGLAWEAHLGGFLFGLLLAPVFYPPALRPAAPENA